MNTHENLIVWRESIELTKSIVLITDTFTESLHGLLGQPLRKAALNLNGELARCANMPSQRQLRKTLFASRGILHEMESLLYLSNEMGGLQDEVYHELRAKTNAIGAMIFKWTSKLKPRFGSSEIVQPSLNGQAV